MIEIGIGHYLTLGAIIFLIGIVGIFLNRKNVIVILMSIELILLAVNINLVSFSIFINKANSEVEAKQNFKVFQKVVDNHLDARVHFCGYLPMSPILKKAVIMKKPVMIHNKKSKEGIAFQKLASIIRCTKSM